MSQKISKQVVVCASCNEMLWMITATPPQTQAQKAVKKLKQEWMSLHPSEFTLPPQDWDCPLCAKPFPEIKGAKVYLKMRSGATGLTQQVLLEKYSR